MTFQPNLKEETCSSFEDSGSPVKSGTGFEGDCYPDERDEQFD